VLIDAAIVPAPSAAFTVMLGDPGVRFVSVPVLRDFSCSCQVCGPVAAGAVAPEPPPAVEPYVIVNDALSARVREETVIVWPETVRVPALDVE